MRRDVCLRTKCECAKRTLSSWALSGHSRVTEQATVCGLRHDRRGLMDYTSVFAEKNAVCNLSGCRVCIPHDGVVRSRDVSTDSDSVLKVWERPLRSTPFSVH